MSEQELIDFAKSRGGTVGLSAAEVMDAAKVKSATDTILGERKPAWKKRGMNKTEVRYASHLEGLRRSGKVLWYSFEAIKLRLADGAFYKPDFAVLTEGLELQFHEVKGFFREAAKVRIKVAADRFPFLFVVVKSVKSVRSGWDIEEISGLVNSEQIFGR